MVLAIQVASLVLLTQMASLRMRRLVVLIHTARFQRSISAGVGPGSVVVVVADVLTVSLEARADGPSSPHEESVTTPSSAQKQMVRIRRTGSPPASGRLGVAVWSQRCYRKMTAMPRASR